MELTTQLDLQSKCSKLKLVLPKSLTHKRLAIVGEALGADEEEQGDYFVGKAGFLLDKLLRECGLIRDAIHITNVLKIRPPDNKVPRLGELGLTIDDFVPYLKEELSLVKPNIILALGAPAMQVLTGKDGITKWRGSTVPCTLIPGNIPVVITLHPSYIQRGQWHLYPYVRHDFETFADMGFGLHKQTQPFEMLIEPTLTQIMDYLNEIYETSTETSIDIETVNKTHITCVGFTKNENSAICIPFRSKGLRNHWAEHEQLLILEAMRRVYQKPGLVKIGQNFLDYDAHYLYPLLGFPREPLFDTLYAHQLIHADARHDLGFIISVYTDMPYHKDDAKDWESKKLPHDQALWEYNCRDTIGTHRAALKLRSDLHELGLYGFLTGYIMPFKRALFEMEWRGIYVDQELRGRMAKDIEDNLLPDALWCIEELTGKAINPNSSKQVGEYLNDVLHIPVPRTDKGNYTVDEDKLEELFARFPKHRRIMEMFICTRKMKAKDLGTYLTAPLSSDGRLRTSFGIAKTGRLTSGTNHRGEGTNLQNQPKRLRVVYKADPGRKLLCPDLVGAEAFVTVWQSGAKKLKAEMLKGKKIHAIVANWITGKPISELPPETYRNIKACVHGSNYKMGVNKFAKTIGSTVEEAKRVREQYFAVFPELAGYHAWVENEVVTKRKLITPYGRVRIFTGDLKKDDMYSAYSQIPQSTIADTINTGILGLWLVKPDDIYLLLQVHDEVVIELLPDRIEWFKLYIEAHLSKLRELWIGDDYLVIPVDIGKAKDRWYGGEK
ncbi:MAG: DNA polymerase [Candidatus Paceibacterota bacterium]